MIVASGFIKMSPGDFEVVKGDLIEAVQAAREQEGCISYAFSADLENPDIMWVNEVWENMESITAHTSKPHFAKLGRALANITIVEQSINLYPATEVIPFGG